MAQRTVLITGAGGLVGSEAIDYYADGGYRIIGLDNDMRQAFFGTSIMSRLAALRDRYGSQFVEYHTDIRQRDEIMDIFKRHGGAIELIIHAAAQPSHDLAARYPLDDFTVNAVGTSHLLEATRLYCPEAVFIFTSTNKVYGDRPNQIPVSEYERRYDCHSPTWIAGINAQMNVDQCLHSLFGASKLAADVLVQEYGRYYGLKTTCLRLGCITGPHHQGAKLHGFLAYLTKCALTDTPYTINGYKGKQVRDNLHARDLIRAFDEILRNPKRGAVYNLGGGRANSCSILEAIDLIEEKTGRQLEWHLEAEPRKGDHRWYITDNASFIADYPRWHVRISLPEILDQMTGVYAQTTNQHPTAASAESNQ